MNQNKVVWLFASALFFILGGLVVVIRLTDPKPDISVPGLVFIFISIILLIKGLFFSKP